MSISADVVSGGVGFDHPGEVAGDMVHPDQVENVSSPFSGRESGGGLNNESNVEDDRGDGGQDGQVGGDDEVCSKRDSKSWLFS